MWVFAYDSEVSWGPSSPSVDLRVRTMVAFDNTWLLGAGYFHIHDQNRMTFKELLLYCTRDQPASELVHS